jgi:hypothetical protein
MKSCAYKLILALVLICATFNSIVAQESAYLDGKSYAITLKMLSGGSGGSSSNWIEDSFIFKSGKMYSLELKKREGFKPASYSPSNNGTEQNPIIKFAYERFNKYGSNLKIQGTAQGNFIEGTAQWTNKAGENIYTFTGTLLE